MIFYFTGTGNSLAVARQLSQALQEPLRAMSDQLQVKGKAFSLQPGEAVGLVFPVYFYTIPRLVADFIRSLRLVSHEKPYIYAVLTCGGQTGQAGRDLERQLLRQRLELSYLTAVVLPDNYVPLLHVPNEKKQQVLFLTAEKDLITATVQIKARKKGDHNAKKGLLSGLLTASAAPLYRDGRKTNRFWASDCCTGCHLCANICPEKTIEIRHGKPVWIKERCTFCLACLHRCPVQAIEHGRTTKGKTRYVHPMLQKKSWETLT